MKNTRWLSGLSIALSLAVPAFADGNATFGFAVLEDGITENRELIPPNDLLAADIPLVSIKTGRRIGTEHFEVLELLSPENGPGFGFVSRLGYEFDHGASLTVEEATLWCNVINEDPEPDFPLPDGAFAVVIVCNGGGEITSGTGIFRNASGTVTRRLQLFEGIGVENSQSDKGVSLFEIELKRRRR